MQWKSSYYFSTVQELSSSATTLDAGIFCWQKSNDILLKRRLWFQETKVSFGWAHHKWCVKESEIGTLLGSFDQQQRKVPHLFLFHLPTQEKERCVIHTVKLLWNNASVIIKLPRSLFKHTACKLKRERCLYKRCTEKKEITGLMPEGTLSYTGIRLISHILYTPPNPNILA